MNPQKLKQLADEGLATVNDYQKLGYSSRQQIMAKVGITCIRTEQHIKVFAEPDARVDAVWLYTPARAAKMVLELSPGSRFNTLAVLFITGQFKPQ
jgi:hypothetical protein